MTTVFAPQVAVIDFNHHRGPEIEYWIDPQGLELFTRNDWGQLPFLALPDGAHAVAEEFSYFTLLSQHESDTGAASSSTGTSTFGISCTRQIRADKLKNKSPDVTRGTVQKAVVVLVNKPSILPQVRERLAATTAAWFAQEDFTSSDILKDFQTSLLPLATTNDDQDMYFGLSLRELIYEFRYQALVLFKCLVLQKKVMFFGSRCERLCLAQFALISLIPNLLQNIEDCAGPELNSYAKKVTKAVNLRTSERSSLLAYMGLPLQIFGEDAFFWPYTPLQQLDYLEASNARSYVIGSTNTLLLSQKEKYCDVVANLDEQPTSAKVSVLDPELRSALSLSTADRRWIDHLTQTVLDTWNPQDPSRPTTHGYQGSEDAIRLSFEEYVLSLLSVTAYKNYHASQPYLASGMIEDHRYPDPNEASGDFNWDFVRLWKQTPNYQLWENLTQGATGIFDIIEPKHPTSGGLNIEDVQRRVQGAMAEFHIDERVRQSRETAGKALEVGREKVGMGVARFWREVESFRDRREQSRTRTQSSNRAEDDKYEISPTTTTTAADRTSREAEPRNHIPPSMSAPTLTGFGTSGGGGGGGGNSTAVATSSTTTAGVGGWTSMLRERASKVQRPDTAQVSSAAKDNAARAGAYLGSWGTWARDRGREWSGSGSEGQRKGEEANAKNGSTSDSTFVSASISTSPSAAGGGGSGGGGGKASAVAAAKAAMGR